MTVRRVLRYPHRVLKTPAVPLAPGPEAEALCADLVDTMRASPACVGLAAPQIGVGVRAFALDVSAHRKGGGAHGLVVMINPLVRERNGVEVLREGCMSLPDFTGNVPRAVRVAIAGETPQGERIEIVAVGFEARAFQHEIDHLDGMLFLDRVSSLTADVFARKRYARPPK